MEWKNFPTFKIFGIYFKFPFGLLTLLLITLYGFFAEGKGIRYF